MPAAAALSSPLPHALQVLVVVVLVGTVFAAGVAAYWPRRSDREQPARRHAQPSAPKRSDKRLSSAAPDKPPYQPPTPGLPPTAGMRAISKLPGQDRLTRSPGAEQHVQDEASQQGELTISAVPDDPSSGSTSPFQRSDPPLAQQEPSPLRRADPPASTAQMPAVLPPLPPIRPRTGPAAPTRSHSGEPPAPGEGPIPPSRPSPSYDPLHQPRETRQQRRERMEALALEEAARLRREQPPESP